MKVIEYKQSIERIKLQPEPFLSEFTRKNGLPIFPAVVNWDIRNFSSSIAELLKCFEQKDLSSSGQIYNCMQDRINIFNVFYDCIFKNGLYVASKTPLAGIHLGVLEKEVPIGALDVVIDSPEIISDEKFIEGIRKILGKGKGIILEADSEIE